MARSKLFRLLQCSRGDSAHFDAMRLFGRRQEPVRHKLLPFPTRQCESWTALSRLCAGQPSKGGTAEILRACDESLEVQHCRGQLFCRRPSPRGRGGRTTSSKRADWNSRTMTGHASRTPISSKPELGAPGPTHRGGDRYVIFEFDLDMLRALVQSSNGGRGCAFTNVRGLNGARSAGQSGQWSERWT